MCGGDDAAWAIGMGGVVAGFVVFFAARLFESRAAARARRRSPGPMATSLMYEFTQDDVDQWA